MRRRGTFFVMWLVLAATLQAAFFPLLHDHAHGHGKPAQQVAARVQELASGDAEPPWNPSQQGALASSATPENDNDPDACAVCAHFAGTCFSILTRHDAAFAAVRAPPLQVGASSPLPWQLAWLLPASRAPPFLSTVTPAFAA